MRQRRSWGRRSVVAGALAAGLVLLAGCGRAGGAGRGAARGDDFVAAGRGAAKGDDFVAAGRGAGRGDDVVGAGRGAGKGDHLVAAAGRDGSLARGATAGGAADGGADAVGVARLRALRPLSAEDVALYTGVMRAAAERLDHLNAQDRAVLARAAELQRQAGGTDPRAIATEIRVVDRALAIRTRMDDDIVRARGIDPARYGLVRDRIESVIPAGGGESGDVAAAETVAPERAEFRRLSAARTAADSAVLAPHRAELQRLIARVRRAEN